MAYLYLFFTFNSCYRFRLFRLKSFRRGFFLCVFLTRTSLSVIGLVIFVFLCVIWLSLSVPAQSIDRLRRPVPEMTCYMSSGMLMRPGYCDLSIIVDNVR